MATKVKWSHVYKDGNYIGFFGTLKDAQAWVKKQTGKFEINDKRPIKKQAATRAPRVTTRTPRVDSTPSTDVDAAMDAAIVATKKAKKKATKAQGGPA